MTSRSLIIYTDGGARGNPGPAAVGVVISDDDQDVAAFGQAIGSATNNEAEYQAVLASLNYLLQHRDLIQGRTLEWRMDSLLVASQLSGKYKIKEPRLKQLASQCLSLFGQLEISYHITHIPRHQNARADGLVNQSLDADLEQ